MPGPRKPTARSRVADTFLVFEDSKSLACDILALAHNEDGARPHVLLLDDDPGYAARPVVRECFGRLLEYAVPLRRLAGRHRRRQVDQVADAVHALRVDPAVCDDSYEAGHEERSDTHSRVDTAHLAPSETERDDHVGAERDQPRAPHEELHEVHQREAESDAHGAASQILCRLASERQVLHCGAMAKTYCACLSRTHRRYSIFCKFNEPPRPKSLPHPSQLQRLGSAMSMSLTLPVVKLTGARTGIPRSTVYTMPTSTTTDRCGGWAGFRFVYPGTRPGCT